MHLSHRVIDRPVAVTMSSSSPMERVEPVSLDTVKQHIRYLVTNEDVLITGWIAAARTYFEELTGRQCVNATWEQSSDCAPRHRHFELPRPPLLGDVVITYDDVDGNPQTFDAANYLVEPSFAAPSSGQPTIIDPYCGCGRIRLVAGQSWPVVNNLPGCFRIQRTCGYGDSDTLMPPMIHTILYLLIAHFHRNRAEVFEAKTRGGDQVLPMGAGVLIEPFKWTALMREPHRWHHAFYAGPYMYGDAYGLGGYPFGFYGPW